MYEKLLFENPHGQSLPYLKYTPKEAPSEEGYPLVVFMHGYGERGPSDGSEVDLVAKHGPFKHIAAGTEYPVMMVAPQCPNTNFWPSYVESMNRFLDHVIAENKIDTDRIYLTGLSMGGTATWLWGMGSRERFAALAPVCGEGITWHGSSLAKMPIWAFHGDIDETVNPHESLEMVSRINKRGGNAKLTLLTGVKHNAWTYAYSGSDLVEWFLTHRLSDRTKPATE